MGGEARAGALAAAGGKERKGREAGRQEGKKERRREAGEKGGVPSAVPVQSAPQR